MMIIYNNIINIDMMMMMVDLITIFVFDCI